MLIDVKGLTKKYEKLTAVDNISFSIKEGETFGLLGPNGAGKTTTLMMLATLLNPSGGTASVNNFDIVKQPAKVRQSIGMVFQDPSSDDLLTGYENLRLHAMMFGVPAAERESRISEALALVDLTDRKDDLVKKYSGGMRRRLELARGLLHQPKILFLDEPTLGLDPQARDLVWRYIEKLSSEKKATIIMTTHYMDEADKLCDRIAIIDHGKIVALDSPDTLKKKLGGDIIRLKVKDPNISAIKKLKFVKKVDRLDDTVSITVKGASKHLQEVLKVVGDVESVELRTPTLNDVFLHFAGREYKPEEENAEGGFGQRVLAYQAKK